jgi:hypothetical protein
MYDGLTYILDKESKRKKLNTPVKENFCKNLFQTEMSEEPIDDIELEEAEPVDGSFLDVSLVEEVNSNSQENYCLLKMLDKKNHS